MREKLIELLKDTRANAAWHHWGYEESAEHLIANGVTISKTEIVATDNNVGHKWIPVTERLPEFNQPCLCYKKSHGHPEYRLGKYLGSTFSDNCAAFRSMSHYGCIGATHWMPLPDPPKGE